MGIWSYEGMRIAIVGCSTGMGQACARELLALGAEVHGAGINKPALTLASFHVLDLKDWSAIDRVVASIGGEIDALFNCSGLPQTFPAADVVRINLMGVRHWSEQWLSRMRPGGAIASISSFAGRLWLERLPMLRTFLAIEREEDMLAWIDAHPAEVGDGYAFSKELLNAWTQIEAVRLAEVGIRLNVIMPGPVRTPMYKDFRQVAGQGVLDAMTAPSGRYSEPTEQSSALIFLNSRAASFVSGACLPIDHGLWAGHATGEIDVRALIANALAR
jgi:NAD(P)-dependent dehydrogenase (short-subunit alcohol dehydrogenase family)